MAMARYATALGATGEGLKKVDDGGWTGQAADRFHEVFDREPGRWFTAGDAFTDASRVLGGYASTLEWAQGQAVEAIALWEQAEDLTRQAEAEHRAALAQAQANAVILSAVGGLAVPPPQLPFHDPGEATRQAARETLDRARQQLDDAGNRAAHVIAQARGEAPSTLMSPPVPMSLWSNIKDFFGGKFSRGTLGLHQINWCNKMGPLLRLRGMGIQNKALEKTNSLAGEDGWSPGQRNAFRHSYWMGLMMLNGFSYEEAMALGEAHEQDTINPDELPGSQDSSADLHNNTLGARIGEKVRPSWFTAIISGVLGSRPVGEEELEKRLAP